MSRNSVNLGRKDKKNDFCVAVKESKYVVIHKIIFYHSPHKNNCKCEKPATEYKVKDSDQIKR